ncbi:MAG: glycosyltransferase family 9 protein [Candidatus Omnitrophota bacterium]|jgi:ADP-heptose:LPS heptosyltransferase
MIKNILVIRNDRFGEFLLNIPAFRALKESFPGSQLTLAVSFANKELAECIECADKVAIWDDDFKKNLRKQKFDLCVVLNPAKEAHWACFWAGIPKRVGYNKKWGILLTHKMQDNKNLGLKHEVECNLDLVGLIDARTVDKAIRLGRLPQHNKPEYSGAIAIHPFTSDSLKQWPVEKFQELIRRLAQDFGAKLIVVGREKDDRKEFDNLGKNVINLVNKTSLVELAQILRQSKLLISCDSGPMHLAAAVGTPVLALFRNDLAGKTARRWGPWGKGHMVIEKSRLEDIATEEIIEIINKKLIR